MWIWYCHFDASWLFCLLVDTFSSLYQWSLPFGVFLSGWYWLFLSLFSVSLRSCCKAGLLVSKSFSYCLSIKDLISHLLMKLSLAGYEILGWKFFSLRILHIGPHSLLACRVSAKRSTMSLMGFPLWVTQPFSLTALSISSFISTLVDLMIICLGGWSSWEISLWCSLYFLDLNVGLPC